MGRVRCRKWLTFWAVAWLALAGGDAFARDQVEREAPFAARSATTIPIPPWIEGRQLAPADIRITNIDGSDLAAEPEKRVQEGELLVAVPEYRQFIVRPADVVTLPMTAQRIDLPGGVVQTPAADADTADWFRPTLMASPLPVTWNEARRLYSTRIFLGLRSGGELAGSSLDHPVTMRFGFRGMTAEPVPDITLEDAGIEHEQVIDLHFLPTTAEPVLELRSDIGDVDLQMDVMQRVELVPLRTSMPGFGLGTVGIDLVRMDPHGVLAPVSADTPVSIQVDGSGTAEPNRMIIPGGESTAHFTLRSSGVGPVTVRVHAGGLSDSRTVSQTLPLMPLLAAILGGALGGYSRRFAKGATQQTAGLRILEGILVALVGYTAAVLGVGYVGLPPVIAATEAGAFLIGALTGFVGVMALEILTRRLGPSVS